MKALNDRQFVNVVQAQSCTIVVRLCEPSTMNRFKVHFIHANLKKKSEFILLLHAQNGLR